MKSVRLIITAVVAVLVLPSSSSAALEISDKSFELLVEAIWSYSSRTFGQIDTLTFSSWDRVRQPAGSSTESSPEVTDSERRLEELVDRPAVEVNTDQDPDLANKLDSTGQTLDQLKLNYQHATSDVGLIGLKWDSLLPADVTKSLEATIAQLEADHKLVWLTKAWDWPELGVIASQEVLAKSSLVTVNNIVSTAGMQPEAYAHLKSALKSLEAIEQLMGERDNPPAGGGSTVFGRYQQTQELVAKWDDQLGQLDQLLEKVGTSEELVKQVLTLNQIPHANLALDDQPQNKILGLRGIVQANKALLAQGRGTTLTTTWLEEGSLVFKTLVTNPSPLSRQEVALRYYLPPEVKETDIVDHDEEVAIKLDSEKNQYYVAGDLTVAAGDTRIVIVRTNDLWQFSPDTVKSMRQQANELVQSLVNTAVYAQSVTIKSDLQVSLDKIEAWQNNIATPEQKITAFRQTSLEMARATARLALLQQLVGRTPTVLGWQSSVASIGPSVVWLGLVAVGVGLFATATWVLLREAGMITSVGDKHRRRRGRSAAVQQFRPFSAMITSSDL